MTDSELNEKLNNDFRAFRIEHDSRIAQKYVEQIPGKGLSEENFTPQEKNKLASLTGGADIDTSQFATKTELQTAVDNVIVGTSQFATKTELQTAISNVAIDSLSSNDVYIPADTYNDIMGKFNVASTSADVNLTEFLNIWTTNAFKKFQIKPTTPMGEYTAEDIYNAAIDISQASRALISDDLYVPQEDLADYFDVNISHLEEVLQIMQSVIPGTFITIPPVSINCVVIYTNKAFAVKMADVFLQYLKANNIVPTGMYYTDGTTTYKITDDNLAWFNVIANGSFEKLTENNLADATELYACCRETTEFVNSDYISPDIQIEGNFGGPVIFAVV